MITAAVVTFHTSRKDLIRLIDCVLHSSIDKFFIIDNSTNDALREFESTSERITYIYSDNLGFGSGHNVAINRAMDLGCDYHIIINPDIYWDENVIEKLTQFMNENRDCGLVSPCANLFYNATSFKKSNTLRVVDILKYGLSLYRDGLICTTLVESILDLYPVYPLNVNADLV